MAQHDYVIANQGFPDFRSDLNSALSAIVTVNSGASAPSTTYANMLWYDSANNILKIRNEDNDAFITLFTLDQSADTASITIANNALTSAAQTFTAGQRGEITTLTDGSSIAIDMAASNNFVVTLGGNRALANPSNLTAGQSGSIFIVQDGSGSRTLSYGSQYDFAEGTAPTLTTTASAVDRIDYVVRTTSSIHCVATLNYS